jgi:hypothetical protein
MSCPSTSSGSKSASAVITSLPGRLDGIDIQPPAANTATLIIYDSATATTSGKTVLRSITIPAGGASVNLTDLCIIANEGIYAVLAGDATTYVVLFSVG